MYISNWGLDHTASDPTAPPAGGGPTSHFQAEHSQAQATTSVSSSIHLRLGGRDRGSGWESMLSAVPMKGPK